MMDETSSSNKKFARDRISELPDEILVSIVSKLSIEEAARTSILSHRWEKLWIHYQGNLEFDVTNKLNAARRRNWPQIKHEFLKSMNHILTQLLLGSSFGSPLNSLIVRFNYIISELVESELDTLVEFVMAKRIRVLELDMYPLPTRIDFFSLPVRFYAWIKQPRGLHTISALTSLSFSNVSVSGDTVEHFVSNCPLLERLCVKVSDVLPNLRIVGDASLKLKYLTIQGFPGMKSLVVSAPNLVSLDYQCMLDETKLDVSNVPNLVEICIGDRIMAHMSGSLSIYLAQIHTLNLFFTASDMEDMDFSLLTPPNNVVFSNLKHLILKVIIEEEDESLLGFTSSIVEASPMLEKFTLDPINSVRDDTVVGLHRMNLTPTRKQYSQNQRLKVVKLNAFIGVAPEVELLVYFVQNFSSSLEQVIIDTRSPPDKVRRHLSNMRRKRGRELKRHIPPGVDFVLI